MLDKVHILTLLGLPGFGRNSVNKIIEDATFTPNSLLELQDLVHIVKENYSRLKVPSIASLEASYNFARSTIEKCYQLNIHVMGRSDVDFPLRLKSISDAPVLLYAKGNYKCLNADLSVAVIGTREPSAYGERCGELYGKWFAEKKLVVVSGLAKGVDAAGHRGCISAEGQTVAVLAQGLDTGIYPAENRSLAQEILERDGCWLSEYTLGVRGRPNFFVERDRLQAGLSAGVVVIETDIKGGTMHTVGFTQEQQKPLGCLNHPEKYLINNDKARGNRYLINQGKALPLFSQEDIDMFIDKMQPLPVLKQSISEKKAKLVKPQKAKPEGYDQLEFF
ncbi:DNA-processing protein DprA [Paenibacillus tengchongensis]|uniref:DNA-processing protein DprA n=1 Tax=Paenibacillus tengchongensis TaxID=2608684 RepID=UPI001651C877|nr:DNA-processing protein DprA [Paenibacillus tengchongensis]